MATRRRILVGLALLLVAATTYAVTFDRKGKFAPTTDADVVVKRVHGRVTGTATDVTKTVKRQKKKLDAPKPKQTLGQRYKRELSKVK